jgi:hypothetical protein
MLPSEEMESNALQCEADYEFFFRNEKKEMEAKASQNVSWKTHSLENHHQNRALELRHMTKPII